MGFLDDYLHEQIDGRIVADPTLPGDLEIFTTYDQAANDFEYNAGCWAADLDFTGVGWRTKVGGAGAEGKRGVLISPRHVACSEHVGPEVGDEFHFIKANGDQIVRTVTGVQYVCNDIEIAYLNQDVPGGIRFYHVLPGDYADYLQWNANDLPCAQEHIDTYNPQVTGLYGKPVLFLKNNRRALIGQISITSPYLTEAVRLYHVKGTGNKAAYWEQVFDGDSGWPGLLVFGGQLLPLELHQMYAESGPCGWNCSGLMYPPRIDLMNAAMADLDTGETGYQLSLANLTFAGISSTDLIMPWLACGRAVPPYEVQSGQEYHSGAAAGQEYHSGAAAGEGK